MSRRVSWHAGSRVPSRCVGVFGIDDGDLVDIELGHPPQGRVQVVIGRDRKHGPIGQVVGQDQRAPFRAHQGQPQVVE